MYGGGKSRGFTILELIIAIAIIGILAGIAVPTYTGYVEKARVERAAGDIRAISLRIEMFRAANSDTNPPNLTAVGFGNYSDPWGNPYIYVDVLLSPPGNVRRDRFWRPLNTDFDLFSTGRNGEWTPRLGTPKSRDDVVRANNGDYVGLAEGF